MYRKEVKFLKFVKNFKSDSTPKFLEMLRTKARIMTRKK